MSKIKPPPSGKNSTFLKLTLPLLHAPLLLLFILRHNFDFFNVSKRLETIPPLGWDRGRSSIHILRSLYGVDWEDMVQVGTFTLK